MEKLSMKENQEIEIEILDAVSEICDKQGYRYYLVFGTLIGAIRHKGFIPWDDDLDIMMPRPDHDKFIEYFISHKEDYPNLRIFTPDLNKEYPYMITRVSDDRYRIVMENEKPYGMGVFIDIYPYDGMGNTWKEAVKFEKRGDYLSSLCFQATRVHLEKGITKSMIRKVIKPVVFIFSKAIGKDFFIKQLKKQAGKKPYESSKYVGNAIWGNGGEICIYDRELFDDYVLVDFEGKKYKAPKGYDKFLRHIYGDYMELPKENDRKPHHKYYVVKNPEYTNNKTHHWERDYE